MTNVQYDNFTIIPHPQEARLLLLPCENDWTLPRHHVTRACDINRAMKEQLGLDLTVLYRAYDRYKDDEREEQHQIYAMENHSPDDHAPAGGRWIDREELDQLGLLVPEHRSVLEAYLAEARQNIVPTQRPPWARKGWFAAASSWVQMQCADLGYTISGPLEQLRTTIWSSILCIPTHEGNLYCKASAPIFSYEAVLTQFLSQHWPDHMPVVLAIDPQRGWMLMRDGGTPLGATYEVEIARMEEMLVSYAHIQSEMAAYADEMQALGSPDRRLARLPALYEEALAAIPLLCIGQQNGLSAEEYEQLRAFTPELKAMCALLASYNIPETLHHDDFHTRNILVQGERFTFFDWAECCLGHPFYSMVILQRDAKYLLAYSDEMLERLCTVYLEQWTRFEPMERLREAFVLAQKLGKLCRALTYYNLIQHIEPDARWEFEGAVPYWLQVFLGTQE